jgi:hypothetical protein
MAALVGESSHACGGKVNWSHLRRRYRWCPGREAAGGSSGVLLGGLAAAGGLWWPCLAWWKGIGRAYGAAAKRLAGPRRLRWGSDDESVACHGRAMIWSMVGDWEGLAGSFMAWCEELGEARRMGALGSCEGVVGGARGGDGGEGNGERCSPEFG